MTEIKNTYAKEIKNIVTEFASLKLDETFFENILNNIEEAYEEDKKTKQNANFLATFRRLIDEQVIIRIQAGNDDLRKLYLLKNLSLITKLKAMYLKYQRLTEEEAISAGVIALDLAINNFDVTKQCAFATYAIPKILKSLNEELIILADNIGVNQNIAKQVHKIIQTEEILKLELHRNPTSEEIAVVVGLKSATVIKYRMFAESISLQSSTSDLENAPLVEEIISDPFQKLTDEKAEYRDLQTSVATIINNSRLTAREKKIIKIRFGLETGVLKTLEETSQDFDLSRERIRQIEAKALKKLMHTRNIQKLKGFLID